MYLFIYHCILIEPRVLRIEKKKVPAPSQPEVVLSDGKI